LGHCLAGSPMSFDRDAVFLCCPPKYIDYFSACHEQIQGTLC